MILGRKAIGTVSYMGGVLAVAEEFLWSWGQMIQYNQECLCNEREFVHTARVKYSDHAPARNTLAREFLGDWLLMLDTDHQFEPDICKRMLHRADVLAKHFGIDVDVLAGFYQFKTPPHSPVVWVWDKPEGEDRKVVPLATYDKNCKLLEIAAAGAGALWVRRGVYNRIQNEFNTEPFTRLEGGPSEDHSFFSRLNKLGIKAYCDPRIQSHHLRMHAITEDDYKLDASRTYQVETYGHGGEPLVQPEAAL